MIKTSVFNLVFIAVMLFGVAGFGDIKCENFFLDVNQTLFASLCVDLVKKQVIVTYSHSIAKIKNNSFIEQLAENTRVLVKGKPLELKPQPPDTKSFVLGERVFFLHNWSEEALKGSQLQLFINNAPITDPIPLDSNKMLQLRKEWRPLISPGELRTLGEHGVDAFERQALALKPHDGSTISATMYRNYTDLHTHYPGAMRADKLVEIGEQHHVRVPVEEFQSSKHINKLRKLADSTGMIDIVEVGRIDYLARQEYIESLQIPSVHSETFTGLEQVYERRKPFTKNVKVFADNLETVAKDYQAGGIKYAELAFKNIIDPEYAEIAEKILPQIEKKYGVKLSFLAAVQRTTPIAQGLHDIEKIRQAALKYPFIKGVSFLGEEVNATSKFSMLIRAASSLKDEIPGWQVQVHAGENPTFPDNVKEAIKAGATRIGHGVYGVDKETMVLAAKNNVIIELNSSSNQALRNVQEIERIRAREYIDNGVRVVIATDGHGMYCTLPGATECSTAHRFGLTKEDFIGMRKLENAYIADQNKAQIVRVQQIAARRSCDAATLAATVLDILK